MASTTTIRVQFGTPTGGPNGDAQPAFLSASLDSRETGLNGGKTSFKPGDMAVILIYKSTNVTLEQPIASAGSISLGSQVEVDITEDLTFLGELKTNLQIPPTGAITGKWLGRSLGSISASGTGEVTASGGDSSKVGVFRATYKGTATVCTLVSPVDIEGATDFAIGVLIVGNVS